ncbi:MAG: hypothetical protein KC482_04970 [Dehalococcoidia bacterium]|nr:hypothetical protein [Dehalococcoidia bacterium]MCA9843110.1 hypothetical protein [Dehalococcoidia bacterium]MCA9852937.1 hypothetical protein [Dehalococcoidia bacterium]
MTSMTIMFRKAAGFLIPIGLLSVAALFLAEPLDAEGADTGQTGRIGSRVSLRTTLQVDEAITVRLPMPALSMVVAD